MIGHAAPRRPPPGTQKGAQQKRRLLTVRNRQRAHSIDLRLLRKIGIALLKQAGVAENFDLGVYILTAAEITRLNESFLQHGGPTDVITFNYSSKAASEELEGEIFICLAEAVKQARSFHTTWQAELVRYLVHGVLHLLGHDDLRPAARARMKREEDRLAELLACQFPLRQLGRRTARSSILRS